MVKRMTLAAFAAVAALLVSTGPAHADQARFPDEIALPDGFRPEGIATGPGPVAYFGSLADGSIYRANLLTGEGTVVSQGPGTPSVGMKTDGRGRLFVAGGTAGDARIVDTSSGAVLASYQLADSTDTFVNDVTLAGGSAWLTDSRQPVLYRLPLRGGLPDQDDVQRIALTGDLAYQEGFNLNGIESTPDGRALLAVQSNTGRLFRIEPSSGATTEVDLGGDLVQDGDGLLLDGRHLYVVQSGMTMAASLLKVDAAGTTAAVVERLADPRMELQSPTTAALFGDRIYIPLAKFAYPQEPTTEYQAIAIPRR